MAAPRLFPLLLREHYCGPSVHPLLHLCGLLLLFDVWFLDGKALPVLIIVPSSETAVTGNMEKCLKVSSELFLELWFA